MKNQSPKENGNLSGAPSLHDELQKVNASTAVMQLVSFHEVIRDSLTRNLVACLQANLEQMRREGYYGTVMQKTEATLLLARQHGFPGEPAVVEDDPYYAGHDLLKGNMKRPPNS